MVDLKNELNGIFYPYSSADTGVEYQIMGIGDCLVNIKEYKSGSLFYMKIIYIRLIPRVIYLFLWWPFICFILVAVVCSLLGDLSMNW